MDIAALILSSVSLVVALYTIIQVEADRRSTHNIQYMPVDDVFKSNIAENKEAPKTKASKYMRLLPEEEIDV